ncbi:MAG TPA: DNA-processing protein DprA [Candidatus Saccharimonadales bacterium]|nr:DNA-processing protein DprA [Candidatus Saccharimonadales bacterium]
MVEINILTGNHKLFEQRLDQLADTPKKVYYIGNTSALDGLCIGIVGSRKPTAYGHEMTYQLAYELAKRGVTIVSGLAIGVDGLAHQAALDAGGRTAAVLAGGLDDIYPHRHRKLAQQIVDHGGVLLSEYPQGMPCLPHQFVARNRLIAALGEGVIVTEAAAKSGSLHTAQFGLELGRTVMAVPGLATNPMASGCLNLLRSGATLVANVEDALFALGYHDTAESTQLPLLGDTPEEVSILELLRQGIQEGEELLLQSKLTPSVFSQTLTMLEIDGRIRPLGSNHWALGQ